MGKVIPFPIEKDEEIVLPAIVNPTPIYFRISTM